MSIFTLDDVLFHGPALWNAGPILKKTPWNITTLLASWIGLGNFVDLHCNLVTQLTRFNNHIPRRRSPCVFYVRCLILWGSLLINLITPERNRHIATFFQIKLRFQPRIHKRLSYHNQLSFLSVWNTRSMNGKN